MSQSPSRCGETPPCSPSKQTSSESSSSLPCYTQTTSTLCGRSNCCQSRSTSSKRSRTTSCEKFCTSNTCRISKNLTESKSPYCSYGVKEEDQDHQERFIEPCCLKQKHDRNISDDVLSRPEDALSCLPTRGSQSSTVNLTIKEPPVQQPLLHPCMAKQQKLNPSCVSNHAPSNTNVQLPCRNMSQNVSSCASSLKAISRPSILKTTDCGLSTCNKAKSGNGLVEKNISTTVNLPSNQDIGVQTSEMVLVPDTRSTCQQGPFNTATNSNKSNKVDVAVPMTSCLSTCCEEKQQPQCQCRYPPVFKQFSCTGKIAGNCDCCHKN